MDRSPGGTSGEAVKATAICDGRGNAGTGARAAVLYVGGGLQGDRYERAEKLPPTTNIVAEHLAIQVKKEHLVPIVARTRTMASEFVSCEVEWTSRENTREADALCRAVDGPGVSRSNGTAARSGPADRSSPADREHPQNMRNRSVELAYLHIPGSGGDVFLLDLVDSWAGHVGRFVEEAGASERAARNRVWGADDWIGALFIRDRLERALGALGIEGTLATIEVTDELFRRFTVADKSGALRLSGIADLPQEPWWWRRVPTTGPVADELAAWSAAEAPDGDRLTGT